MLYICLGELSHIKLNAILSEINTVALKWYAKYIFLTGGSR